MEFSARQIAEIIDGQLIGNPEVKIYSFGKIESATQGDLTFLSNTKYEKYLPTTRASAVIVSNARNYGCDHAPQTTLICVEQPYLAFAKLLHLYDEQIKVQQPCGIHATAIIAPNATVPASCFVGALSVIEADVQLGEHCRIFPQCYIGRNVHIGKNVTLYAGVKIYNDTHIGDNCLIHSGAVIGADGFGFTPDKTGDYQKIPQIGRVFIDDNVEIGANTTVDRATMGDTYIGKGVKIDNLVQVAHNVRIEKDTVIASQTGIAGSTQIGERVIVGGQAGISGHLRVGNGTQIGPQTGIVQSTGDGERVWGTPAISFQKYSRSSILFRQLPELFQRLRSLEKTLEALHPQPKDL